MSQIDRRLKNMQQADLTESRVNDDFLHWLKTWGQNILLAVLVVAALAMGYFWWSQKKEQARDEAWSELASASLPAALEEVAAKHEGKDAVAPFAEILAADRYLQAVMSNQRFDREASAADAALTPELRTEWLKEADRLYAKVATRMANAKRPGEYGFLFGALFGRAAVAEDMGDLKAAEGFLKEIEAKSKDTDFASTGTLAAKRLESLQTLATKVELPSRPAPLAAPAAIPDLTAPGAPSILTPTATPAPAGSPSASDDIVKQLQGSGTGSAPAPAPAPKAP
jgi:predicted negative regulator of RcsB-dependent stress response